MHPVRKRKLLFILFMIAMITVVIALVMYALRQNINLFFSPTQIVLGQANSNAIIRVGGVVVKGSVVRGSSDLNVRFKLTDYKQTINVYYHGILPDLFREGQGIVALGKLIDNQNVKAHEVLAKHDENYMPPEIKEAIS